MWCVRAAASTGTSRLARDAALVAVALRKDLIPSYFDVLLGESNVPFLQ